MLDPRETFEKYERRSPQPCADRRDILACEFRREPAHQSEYRREVVTTIPVQRQNTNGGTLACELRARPTTITTFLPESDKKKFPVGLIVAIAICIPVFIVIILFAAVWFQELGWI
ncbi:unnamed protein product [Caenorhabditis bovis]|uniref:Uncharacterized protein n=1 Tax=Caenorhabditis bovis TaxID=2654633 RepID=A0A8S1FA34_9PELO|nr:unnamed protein product [Caenorhabditis bovis]